MKINEKEYNLELTGYTLVVYKQEFKKDLFSAITEMEKGIDLVTLLEILWAFLKCADSSTPNFEEFSKSITDIKHIMSKEVMGELIGIIKKSSYRTVEEKNV